MATTRIMLSAAVLAGLTGLGMPAQAATGFGVLPMSVALVGLNPHAQCSVASPAPGAAAPSTFAVAVYSSKASAILGGQVSRLELIARQQSGMASLQLASPLQMAGSTKLADQLGATTGLPGSGLAPAAGSACAQFALPRSQSFAFQPSLHSIAAASSEDFLASKRLAVRHTAFDGAWDRVRRQSLPHEAYAALGRSTSGLSETAMFAAVNSWTNAKVHYVEDAQQYGQMDYWADARTTLARGAGDCEDIAIAKMQLLAALGVSRSDMFLTIARDTVRHADHALLVVKSGDRSWLLDNASDQVLDASQSYDYRPILSFSNGKKWLHGY